MRCEALSAFGTGTTSATATLVSPPGKAAGGVGPKYTVIDSISVGAVGSTTAITAGTLEIQNNGVGQGQLFSDLQVALDTMFTEHYDFPRGLLVPHVAAGDVTVVLSGVTGASQCRVVVTYHFADTNQI